MSQAAKIIKKTVSVVVILCLLSVTVAVAAAYLNTNRDTRKAPEKVSEKLDISKKGYNKIYQSDKKKLSSNSRIRRFRPNFKYSKSKTLSKSKFL